jgi:hypothetical protein
MDRDAVTTQARLLQPRVFLLRGHLSPALLSAISPNGRGYFCQLANGQLLGEQEQSNSYIQQAHNHQHERESLTVL